MGTEILFPISPKLAIVRAFELQNGVGHAAMQRAIVFAISALTFAIAVSDGSKAQQPKEEAPKTKLEAFTGVVGVASIKGYVEVGAMRGSSPISVTAMIIRDAKTGKETSGAVFEITEIKSYGVDRSRSYVDVEEISDLLSGLTYISKADETVTPMRFYEAQYLTRGGLRLTVFNNAEGQRQFLVHVGGLIGGKDSYFQIQELPNFWDLIAKAKEVIENPQQLGKMNSNAGSATTSAPPAPLSPIRPTKKP